MDISADAVGVSPAQLLQGGPGAVVCLHDPAHVGSASLFQLSLQIAECCRDRINGEGFSRELEPLDLIARIVLKASLRMRRIQYKNSNQPDWEDFSFTERDRCFAPDDDFEQGDKADLAVGFLDVTKDKLPYSFDCRGPGWDGSSADYAGEAPEVGSEGGAGEAPNLGAGEGGAGTKRPAAGASREQPLPKRAAKGGNAGRGRVVARAGRIVASAKALSPAFAFDENRKETECVLHNLLVTIRDLGREGVAAFDSDGDNDLYKATAILMVRVNRDEFEGIDPFPDAPYTVQSKVTGPMRKRAKARALKELAADRAAAAPGPAAGDGAAAPGSAAVAAPVSAAGDGAAAPGSAAAAAPVSAAGDGAAAPGSAAAAPGSAPVSASGSRPSRSTETDSDYASTEEEKPPPPPKSSASESDYGSAHLYELVAGMECPLDLDPEIQKALWCLCENAPWAVYEIYRRVVACCVRVISCSSSFFPPLYVFLISASPQEYNLAPRIANLAPPFWFEVPFGNLYDDGAATYRTVEPVPFITHENGVLLSCNAHMLHSPLAAFKKALSKAKTASGESLWELDVDKWDKLYDHAKLKAKHFVSICHGFAQIRFRVKARATINMSRIEDRIEIRFGPSERLLGLHRVHDASGTITTEDPHAREARFFPPEHRDDVVGHFSNSPYWRYLPPRSRPAEPGPQ